MGGGEAWGGGWAKGKSWTGTRQGEKCLDLVSFAHEKGKHEREEGIYL
jgi:hypothetical protein